MAPSLSKVLSTLQDHSAVGLRIRLGDPLAHEVEEGKLRGAGAELIDEARGEVGAEDSAEVVVWYLLVC